MKSAETIRRDARNPDARQGQGASFAAPQGEPTARIEATIEANQDPKLGQLGAIMKAGPAMAAQRNFVDSMHHGSRQAAQAKLFDAIHNSPRQAAQRNAFDAIHDSPHQAAQLQRFERLFGGGAASEKTVQRREAEPRGAMHVVSAAKNPTGNGTVVQRITLALGDLQEAEHNKKTLSKSETESASQITEAEETYRRNSGETQVHPWDTRFRPFYSGGLADIGGENLRIYGHGQAFEGEKVVSMIGGYTPESLCNKLIELGLPNGYSGEIYLTGCDTAVGFIRTSFLGKFYALITKHCPSVKVRGNMGVATTRKDGKQGVWTGAITEEAYNSARNALTAKMNIYLPKNREMMNRVKALEQQDESLKKQEQALGLGNPREKEKFAEQRRRHVQACVALEESASEISRFIKMISKAIMELDDIAYDTSGRLTKVMPGIDSNQETRDVINAIKDAEEAEQFRLAKLEIAEQLALMYGWGEKTVTEQVYGGKLDEQARARVRARSEEAPSYIL